MTLKLRLISSFLQSLPLLLFLLRPIICEVQCSPHFGHPSIEDCLHVLENDMNPNNRIRRLFISNKNAFDWTAGPNIVELPAGGKHEIGVGLTIDTGTWADIATVTGGILDKCVAPDREGVGGMDDAGDHNYLQLFVYSPSSDFNEKFQHAVAALTQPSSASGDSFNCYQLATNPITRAGMGVAELAACSAVLAREGRIGGGGGGGGTSGGGVTWDGGGGGEKVYCRVQDDKVSGRGRWCESNGFRECEAVGGSAGSGGVVRSTNVLFGVGGKEVMIGDTIGICSGGGAGG
ncbi:MAG: hypothetical protein M1827_007496 [Pycnora praestabilis]|nr:MAG: hypothetical protein M1827_007496 [Pycnora praestabilis]